jgi:hypothetical protein
VTERPGATDRPDITLTRTAEQPQCPLCGREGLLSASVPVDPAARGRRRGDCGATGSEVRQVVLCPACDVDNSAAAPLILFFAVHGRVTAQTAELFARLLRIWTDSWAAWM